MKRRKRVILLEYLKMDPIPTVPKKRRRNRLFTGMRPYKWIVSQLKNLLT